MTIPAWKRMKSTLGCWVPAVGGLLSCVLGTPQWRESSKTIFSSIRLLVLIFFFNVVLDSEVLPESAAAKSLQSCLTLCNPIDGSPPGSPVPGILQARTQEWGAISFSNAWKWKVKVKSVSRVRLFTTPWTAAYQAPLSMGFSMQEYWTGVPLSSPGNSL